MLYKKNSEMLVIYQYIFEKSLKNFHSLFRIPSGLRGYAFWGELPLTQALVLALSRKGLSVFQLQDYTETRGQVLQSRIFQKEKRSGVLSLVVPLTITQHPSICGNQMDMVGHFTRPSERFVFALYLRTRLT